MITILYGEDDFTIRERLSQIKADCGASGLGDAGTTTFDGQKLSFDELAAACNTISFLAPKRLVIVEGLLGRFEKKEKRGKGNTKSPELKEWEALAGLTMPETTVMVIVDGKVKKTNPLLKKLSPVAEIREYAPFDLRDNKLPEWILARARLNGGSISPQAVKFLIEITGNNLWILASEINKLCLYAGDRPVNEADIRLMVSGARESNIFHLVDAVVQQKQDIASRMLHQLLDEGSAPPYLLFMITHEFRLLIQVKELSTRRLPASIIGSKIGEFKEWKVDKMLKQARKYSMESLVKSYRRLLETDLAIKTGGMEGETALDLLITDLCRK